MVLPGARGVATPDDFVRAGLDRDSAAIELAQDESEIVIYFQEGYRPGVDGCVTGAAIGGIPVRGVDVATGADVDLTPCGGAETDPANEDSQTLYHPLAGCFVDPTEADNGRSCPIGRDYEDEFLNALRNIDAAVDAAGGRIASVFRTELSRVSWNLLVLLVVTSCDETTPDRTNRRDCFDPTTTVDENGVEFSRAWDVGRCSLAAPQECLNVQSVQHLADAGGADPAPAQGRPHRGSVRGLRPGRGGRRGRRLPSPGSGPRLPAARLCPARRGSPTPEGRDEGRRGGPARPLPLARHGPHPGRHDGVPHWHRRRQRLPLLRRALSLGAPGGLGRHGAGGRPLALAQQAARATARPQKASRTRPSASVRKLAGSPSRPSACSTLVRTASRCPSASGGSMR